MDWSLGFVLGCWVFFAANYLHKWLVSERIVGRNESVTGEPELIKHSLLRSAYYFLWIVGDVLMILMIWAGHSGVISPDSDVVWIICSYLVGVLVFSITCKCTKSLRSIVEPRPLDEELSAWYRLFKFGKYDPNWQNLKSFYDGLSEYDK